MYVVQIHFYVETDTAHIYIQIYQKLCYITSWIKSLRYKNVGGKLKKHHTMGLSLCGMCSKCTIQFYILYDQS